MSTFVVAAAEPKSTLLSSRPTASTAINEHNHGALVVIAAGVSLGTAIIALAMRMSQRWPRSDFFKLEDILLVLATLSDIANVAAVGLAVQVGLGQPEDRLSSEEVQQTKQALTASFAITFLTEGLSAVSFVCLLYNMNPKKWFRRAMFVLIAMVSAWSLAGIIRFAAAMVSDPERGTWIVFAAFSIMFQLSLMGSALSTIWPLQMPVSRKLGLSLWFSLALPVVAVTIVRLTHIPSSAFAANFTWNDTNMVIISLVESNLAIINAAYPSIRSFLNQVSTGFLIAETAKDSRSASVGQSYGLRSIVGGRDRSKRKSASRAKSPAIPGLAHIDGSIIHHSTAVKGDHQSSRSFGSEVIMVRHSVEIDAASIGDSGER
ncbi:uncharacterized protein LTR77_004095 [Saxophila tyrrhenica]|uniref:Rhodopsin domain-containing protein n=1 Tax=Saxophila tyrrhenica TaxID=1690608 RepID=A0AAV9PBT5_9PEZI|nr:hypothetical protein LTR77_004095 [Saxophila tyrrhenica]